LDILKSADQNSTDVTLALASLEKFLTCELVDSSSNNATSAVKSIVDAVLQINNEEAERNDRQILKVSFKELTNSYSRDCTNISQLIRCFHLHDYCTVCRRTL